MNPNHLPGEQHRNSLDYIPGVGPHRPSGEDPAPKNNPTQTAGVTNETGAGGPAGDPPLNDLDDLALGSTPLTPSIPPTLPKSTKIKLPGPGDPPLLMSGQLTQDTKIIDKPQPRAESAAQVTDTPNPEPVAGPVPIPKIESLTPEESYEQLLNSVRTTWQIYAISGEDVMTEFNNFVFKIVQNKDDEEARIELQKKWKDLVTLAKETSNRNIPQELINDWFKGKDIDAIRGDIQTMQGDFNEDLSVSINNSRRISEASTPGKREETIDLSDTSLEDRRFKIAYALCEIANNPLMTGKRLMTPGAIPAKEGLAQSTMRIDDESGLNQLFQDRASYDSANDELSVGRKRLIEQIDKFNKVNKSAVTANTASTAAMAEPTTPAATTTTEPPAIAIQLSNDGTTITNLAELNASITDIDNAQPNDSFLKEFESKGAPWWTAFGRSQPELKDVLQRAQKSKKMPSDEDIEKYKKLRANLRLQESPGFQEVKNALVDYNSSEQSYQDLRERILQAQLEMKWANDKMTIPVSLLGVRDDASIKALERDNIDMSVVHQKFKTFLENALPIFDLPHAWRSAFVKSDSTEADRNPAAKATLFLNSLFKELLVPHNPQDKEWLSTEVTFAHDSSDYRLAPNIALCGTLLGYFIDSGSTETVPEQIRKAFKTEHTYQNDLDITDYDDLVAITVALYNELKSNHPEQLGVLEQIHNFEGTRIVAAPIAA